LVSPMPKRKLEFRKKTFEEEPNMKLYEEAVKGFKWKDWEKEFDWHKTGKVNMAHEAIDRHVETWRKNKVALYYIDDERYEKYTFQEMMFLSNKFANVLRKYGIKKGDRVFTFAPRSPEVYVSIFGILKVGAIPSPLFEAFMEDAIRDRMQDSTAVAILTASFMKDRIPRKDLPALKHVFVLDADQDELGEGEVSWKEEMDSASKKLDRIQWLKREDPLILHYTSGSTGKPKGVLHVQNAMIGHLLTARWVLDLHEDDIYWCTSDPGWVTGTSY